MLNLDFQLFGITAFITLFIIMAGMFERRFLWIGLGNILLVMLYWGNDICSRSDRVDFFTDHFAQGKEIICRGEHANALLISQSNGWEIRGRYLFKADQGIDVLEDQCEIPSEETPACLSTQWLIAALALFTLGLIMVTIWLFQSYGKKKEQRLEKIRQACEEMAPLYRTDLELKEWRDFVGDVPQDYTRSELYPYNEFAANIEVLLEKLSSGKLDKIGIVYNDSLSAIVLPIRKKGEDHEKL